MSSFSLIVQKEKYFLIFLLLFSFVLRSVFFYILVKDKKYWVCKDSAEYHSVAEQVALGNGISNSQGEPTFFRVPGYSIFLAVFYKIFNFDITKTLWVQVLLSSLIPILVFFLAIALFPMNFLLAKSSSIFVALSIGSILNSALLMSDSIFVLFLLFFALIFFPNFELFFCRNIKRFSWQTFFLAGIFLGIVSLIRPVGHYIICVSIFILFFSNFVFSNKIKSSFFLFCGWILIVFWWILRNWLLTGVIFFHSMPGIHFFNYLACEVDSQANRCTYSESKERLLKKWDNLILEFEQKNGARISEIEKGNLASCLATETVQKYPFVTLKHCFVNFFKTCFSLHSSFILFLFAQAWPDYNGTTSLWYKIKHHLFLDAKDKWFNFLIYYEIILLLILIIGFFGYLSIALSKIELLCTLLKCLPIILLFILLTFGSGVARLRLPIEPFLTIFAFYFWLDILFKRKFSYEK